MFTGGSRETGAAISKILPKRGANVVVNCFNNEESANTVVSEFKSFKDRVQSVRKAIAMQANVTNNEQVTSLMSKSRRHLLMSIFWQKMR